MWGWSTLAEDLPCQLGTDSTGSPGEHNPPKMLCSDLLCGIARAWVKLWAVSSTTGDLSWVWEPLISSLCDEIKWKFVKNEELVALQAKTVGIHLKAVAQHQGKPERQHSVEGLLAREVTVLEVEQISVCTVNIYL